MSGDEVAALVADNAALAERLRELLDACDAACAERQVARAALASTSPAPRSVPLDRGLMLIFGGGFLASLLLFFLIMLVTRA
jgi:hypothetical protein